MTSTQSPNVQHSEETISTRRIHEGRIINLREDTIRMPSGRDAKREIVEHKGAVCIVPVQDDGRVVLVRQYRKPAEDALLEIPAGGLEVGEDAEECARRELGEECGLQAVSMTPLWSCFLAPGYSTELIHCFLAETLTPTPAHPDEDENVAVEIYTLDELLPMIDDGRIRDAKTIAGVFALYRRRTANA
jgi:ADP-ribose pyrophosphatase